MPKSNSPTKDIFDATGRALRHKGLRHANEKTVLRVVGFNPGVSNAEISRMSGLAPQTVSAILVNLERDGLVERGEALRGRRGQPATPILLARDGGFALGVELGWRHADVILLNLHAEVIAHRRIDYAYPDANTIFTRIGIFIDELRAFLAKDKVARLLDVGLAMPGNLADGLESLGAPKAQSALWRLLDPQAELAARTGLDVSLINDGNAACWAELIAMAPPRPSNITYFLVSHYVAAGVIGEGALWHGPTGNAANLGSMLVQLDANGPAQVHSIASLWALAQRLKAAGRLPDTAWPLWDWSAIADDVDSWIDDCAKALAISIFNTTRVVESPLVIIDTVLSRDITERLTARVIVELDALPVPQLGHPEVRIGHHGAMAPAIGAAELPLFGRYF